nr:hypothetical protein [uncultured Campylobacter sp.]
MDETSSASLYSKSNPCTIKTINVATVKPSRHGSDMGGEAVKAAPKLLPSQQKEQRRHKKSVRHRATQLKSSQ